MNTFSYQTLYAPAPVQPEVDWLDCEWGGPYTDDDEEVYPTSVCGEASCPGDCYVCVTVTRAMKRIFVPIQGPVNRDGMPLGFLLITD